MKTFEFETYSEIKEQIMPRLMPVVGHEDQLKDMPHRTIEDIAITYSIVLEKEPSVILGRISNELMELFEITEEQLFNDAMACAPSIMPATIKDIVQSMKDIFDEMSEADLSELPIVPIYVVSNSTDKYGASAIFYPGVMNQLAKEYGSYYILPSSINEMIIVPDRFALPPKDLADTVRIINAHDVSPEILLTNSVYHYDAVTHEFRRVHA